jgi:nucleoid-associated protein YgaU
MILRNKYQKLIYAAQSSAIKDLQVREQNDVLYIDGVAPSQKEKDQLWDIYNKIDPDYRSADVVMDIKVDATAQEEYEVVAGDNLTKIGKKYGMDWQKIYEANKDQIKNPDLIQPGWKLKIPKA